MCEQEHILFCKMSPAYFLHLNNRKLGLMKFLGNVFDICMFFCMNFSNAALFEFEKVFCFYLFYLKVKIKQ